MNPKKTMWILSTLDWMSAHNMEGWRVTIGCKTCKESANIMVGTTLGAWLPSHVDHDIWMKNPFAKKKAEAK